MGCVCGVAPAVEEVGGCTLDERDTGEREMYKVEVYDNTRGTVGKERYSNGECLAFV